MSGLDNVDDTEACSSPDSTSRKQNYICDVCGAKLSRAAHLQRHKKLHLSEDAETYVCHVCDKSFGRKDVYQRHKRSVHGPAQTTRRASKTKSCRRCVRYKLRCSRDMPCIACLNRGVPCSYDPKVAAGKGREKPLPDHHYHHHQNQQPDDDAAAPAPGPAPGLDPEWPLQTLSDLTIAASMIDGAPNNPHFFDPQMAPPGTSPLATGPSQYGSGGGGGSDHADDAASSHAAPQSATSFSSCPPPYEEVGPGNMPVVDNKERGHHRHGSCATGMKDPGAAEDMDGSHVGSSSSKCDVGPSQFEPEAEVGPSFDFYDWDILRASRMDWLGCETEISDGPTTISPGRADNSPGAGGGMFQTAASLVSMPSAPPLVESWPAIEAPERQRGGNSAVERHSNNNSNHNTEELAGNPRDRPSSHNNSGGGSNNNNKETWPAVLDRGGNETWPFDYTSNKGFRKITLPPLRQILEQTVGERPAIERNTLRDLIKVLSAPHIPSFNETPALEAMPAVSFLGGFIKVYFAEFHPVLPVIHIPTWRIERCPTALLAAMACLGATYSTNDGSQEVSALLAEITQRALFWMGQADSTAFRNSAYITASCFHQIFSLGSGNRRLYELADASRGLLVTSLRGLGILSSDFEQTDTFSLDVAALKRLSPGELEAAWLQWRDKEMEKRMAWSVFEFDCTLSTLTSKRGAFRIAELPCRLPCHESIWEAHSAQAWAAILPFSASPPGGIVFYPLLRDVIAGKADLSSSSSSAAIPAWGKRLCVQAISRMLHDLREVEDAASGNNLGIPSLADAHRGTRTSLLGALTSLQRSLAQPTCTSEIVNMNIGVLATHIAHLSSGHQTMDLVIYVSRNSGRPSGGGTSPRELAVAREHLRAVLGRAPREARRMAAHAAAVIGVARECTINTPCETMRVFMAYAFLLAFIRFFPFPSTDKGVGAAAAAAAEGGDGGVPAAFRLDDIAWARSLASSEQVERWIESGGPASVEDVPDICDPRNFERLKLTALRAMKALRVWGLATKFYKTIGNFT